MNEVYRRFKREYFDELLEGQSIILRDLEKKFYSELEDGNRSYYPTLVRMPTGTGKTGVIAISTYLANYSGSSLILTPWKNLCDQLVDDCSELFWEKLGVSSEDKAAHIFEPSRIFPSDLKLTLEKCRDRRTILIGTFSGLQSVQQSQPEIYKELKEKLSLVVVDEGHYEPAVLWGRAVKNLMLPTLLVTATPYRNDLKLFRVPSERVFHYEHFKAEKAPRFPLRKVTSHRLRNKSSEFKALMEEFVKLWKKLRRSLPSSFPRAIVCCDTKLQVMDALRIVTKNGLTARAFHERADEEDFGNNPKMKKQFQRLVPPAKQTKEEIWIHQNKLTEGVDDPRFSAIVLTYPIPNDRKLVQQVGRALRHASDAPSRTKGNQSAVIVHCADYDFDEVWENYLAYERQISLTTGEHYKNVVSEYLKFQPDHEYFDRKFRKRLAPFAFEFRPTVGKSSDIGVSNDPPKDAASMWVEEARSSIYAPPNVLILRTKEDFQLSDLVDSMTDSLLLRDGIPLTPTGDDKPVIHEEFGPVMWLYALIRNSDILLRRSAYEITIEARFVHLARGYLFIADTSGISHEEYLSKYANAADYFTIAKCLNADDTVRQASLFNTQSLNTAVRRAVRQGVNLDVAPYQISESKYVCQNIRARVQANSTERYFGLTTGRISQRVGREKRSSFNLAEFTKWAEDLARDLDHAARSTHSFLGRFAKVSRAPVTAKPYALILDPDPDPADIAQSHLANATESIAVLRVIESEKEVGFEETVFLIEASADEKWPFVMKVELKEGKKGAALVTEILLRYEPDAGRFVFKKGNKTTIEVLYRNDTFSFAHFLNSHHDRYAITLAEPPLVYHNFQFFSLDYSQAEAKFSTYVKRIPALKDVDFEKIPKKVSATKKSRMTAWPDNSVFSKTIANVIDKRRFGSLDWLFCDDLDNELADFIAANFDERKVAFIHCKYGGGSKLSATAFHDLCSQASKNLVYLRTNRFPDRIMTWNRDSFWNKTKIKRWIIGSARLPERKDLWMKLRHDILDHPAGHVEIWLVLGDGLEVEKLQELAGQPNETPELGPLLHLLDGLVANCAEAAATLKVFGN